MLPLDIHRTVWFSFAAEGIKRHQTSSTGADMEHRIRIGGAGWLLALAGGLSTAVTGLTARVVAIAPHLGSPGARVEDWVELGIVGVAAIAAAWVALGALLGLVVVAVARAGVRWRLGEAAVRRLTPGVVRRLVRTGVGVGLGASLALGPAAAFAAAPVPEPAGVAAVADAGSAADGVDASISGRVDLAWHPTAVAPAQTPSPTTPSAAPAPAPSVVAPAPAPSAAPVPHPSLTSAPGAASASRSDDGTVVVLRGDTLWDIAARSLGGEPSDAQIVEATTRWYDANRGVIGDDPDRILPGQILARPA